MLAVYNTNNNSTTVLDEIKKKSKKWSNKVVSLFKGNRKNSTNTSVVDEEGEEMIFQSTSFIIQL